MNYAQAKIKVYDICFYHVETKDGRYDLHKNEENLSVVICDNKSYYYDISAKDVSPEDFAAFVNYAFSSLYEWGKQYKLTAAYVYWNSEVFRANLDD